MAYGLSNSHVTDDVTDDDDRRTQQCTNSATVLSTVG